jgi:large subunit ribosomal protein L22
VLIFSPQKAAGIIRKVLESAIANAENNHDLDPDDLVVTSAVVDEGPTLKRFQPRAMGRAYRIRKRTSHITIILGTSRSLAPRNTRRTGSAGRKTEE